MIDKLVDDELVLARIKNISIFVHIKDNEESLKSLLEIIVKKSYRKDEIIIKEGTIGSEMYMMLNGAVRIQKKTRAGDSYAVAHLKAEDNVFFGELALIDDDKRSATVKASVDSEFLVINKHDFIKLCEEKNHIGWYVILPIARMIAANLRKTSGDMLTIFDALVNEIDDKGLI